MLSTEGQSWTGRRREPRSKPLASGVARSAVSAQGEWPGGGRKTRWVVPRWSLPLSQRPQHFQEDLPSPSSPVCLHAQGWASLGCGSAQSVLGAQVARTASWDGPLPFSPPCVPGSFLNGLGPLPEGASSHLGRPRGPGWSAIWCLLLCPDSIWAPAAGKLAA